MVIFLVGLVSMILMRTLRKDYARYSKDDELDDMVRKFLNPKLKLFTAPCQMACHMTWCGKNNKLCRNFWWENAEECVNYAENKLGYAEKFQQLTKLSQNTITPSVLNSETKSTSKSCPLLKLIYLMECTSFLPTLTFAGSFYGIFGQVFLHVHVHVSLFHFSSLSHVEFVVVFVALPK